MVKLLLKKAAFQWASSHTQVTESHAIKEGRRTTPRRRLEMNDWNGEEDERSEMLMDGSSWHLIVIRRRHSLANHAGH